MSLGSSTNPAGFTGRQSPGGNAKTKDWIPFVSRGIAQAALMLGIAAFGFAHLDSRMDRLEARMDRIEERLDDLDRRVSRIEGVLMLRADQDLSARSAPRLTPGRGVLFLRGSLPRGLMYREQT